MKVEKKKNGKDDPFVRLRPEKQSVPNPQFDEYYIYTSKPNFPTGMITQAGKNAVKILQKTRLLIVHQD